MNVEHGNKRQGRSPIRIVAFDPSLERSVSRLCGRVFGLQAIEGFLRRLQWVGRFEPSEGASRRLVMLRGEDAVGFLSTVPIPHKIAGETLLAHTPSEYMVREDHRFHGIGLMRECLRDLSNCVSCDDVEATLRVSELLGLSKVAPVTRFTKVLDAAVVLQRVGLSGLAPAVSLGLAAADKARSLRRRGMEVSTIPDFDARFDELFDVSEGEGSISVVRDARFLRWRYGPYSPHPDREIGVVEEEGRLRGYVVLHRSRRSGRVGRILALEARDRGDDAVLGRLLVHAVDRLRALGARTARFHRLDSRRALSTKILRDHGFVPRSEHWLMVRFADERRARTAGEASRWSLSFGDSEASFAGR